MNIHPVGTELFNAVKGTDGRTDRQADRQTDMTNLIFALRNVKKNLKFDTANLRPRCIRVIRRCRHSSCRSSWGGKL